MSTIEVDSRSWNLVLRMLKRLGHKVSEVDTDLRRVYNITDHGVTPIVARNAHSLEDQSSAAQALADRAIDSLLGSKIWIPASPYVWNDGVTFPENRAVIVEGDGPGWRSNAGKGSVLQRTDDPSATALARDDAGAMLAFFGSDSGDSQRAIGGVRHLQLNGGYDAGVTEGYGLTIQRAQEFTLDNVRLYNFPGTALLVNQAFNCAWYKLRVTHSGDDASGAPAVKIGGQGQPGNVDGTITLDIHGLQLEQNRGIDLQITGNPVGVGHPSTEINIFGGKCEGPGDGSNTNPYHHLAFCELVSINGHGIFSHRSVPAILVETESEGTLVQGPGEDRGVTYTGCWFEIGAGITPPDYFIEVLGGSVHFANCTFKMDVNTALAHVGPDAREGAISFNGCRFFDLGGGPSSVPYLFDER